MVGLECHNPLAEARKCVQAAEMLRGRAWSLGSSCSAGRRASLRLAFIWHVERATRLVEEVKAEEATGRLKRHTLDDARKSVEAAEILRKRAWRLGPKCSAKRREAVWQAFDWHVERATRILEELKGETVARSGRYFAKEARIAFIAAPRP
jgi:hypothetical protein